MLTTQAVPAFFVRLGTQWRSPRQGRQILVVVAAHMVLVTLAAPAVSLGLKACLVMLLVALAVPAVFLIMEAALAMQAVLAVLADILSLEVVLVVWAVLAGPAAILILQAALAMLAAFAVLPFLWNLEAVRVLGGASLASGSTRTSACGPCGAVAAFVLVVAPGGPC